LDAGRFIGLGLSLLILSFPAPAQLWQAPAIPGAEGGTEASVPQQLAEQPSSGSISGRVVDQTGVAVAGATVKLTREGQPASQTVLSTEDGKFSLADVAPGPFKLTITAPDFAAQTVSGNLRSGENYTAPQIVLAIATNITEVHVVPSPVEVAQEQIEQQEKQRTLGFIPNFYVTYVSNAAPLTPKQKFELAWKTIVDPVTFGLTGVVAGVQQANDDFNGYGQGAQGYAKRYGAVYADAVTSTFLGSALLPSLLKQDPRYFYKGTGSNRSRVLYAVANSVICKGDNGHWQANYSGIIGGLAADGISNLYYPPKDRKGAELTFENALIGIGTTAAANILQEFVIKKFTTNVPNPDPGNTPKPLNAIGKLLNTLVHEGD
jgi:Carboxypeptidase regulatory-like domain